MIRELSSRHVTIRRLHTYSYIQESTSYRLPGFVNFWLGFSPSVNTCIHIIIKNFREIALVCPLTICTLHTFYSVLRWIFQLHYVCHILPSVASHDLQSINIHTELFSIETLFNVITSVSSHDLYPTYRNVLTTVFVCLMWLLHDLYAT